MAVIDYNDVMSLRYAELSLPAKALIPVLATLADKETGLIPERHSKLDALAAFAGISRRATRDALLKLRDTKRISLTRIHGHPAKIIYLPIAQFSSKAGEAGDASLERHEVPHQDLLDFAPDPRLDCENQERQDPCSLNRPLNSLKTTTDLAISEEIIQEMTEKCGDDVVVKVISGMEELEELSPGHIKNPEAYFRKCCEKDWQPTTKELQEKEKAKERREKERKRHEELDMEFQRMKEDAANCDPLVAQKAMAAINAMLADVPAA